MRKRGLEVLTETDLVGLMRLVGCQARPRRRRRRCMGSSRLHKLHFGNELHGRHADDERKGLDHDLVERISASYVKSWCDSRTWLAQVGSRICQAFSIIASDGYLLLQVH